MGQEEIPPRYEEATSSGNTDTPVPDTGHIRVDRFNVLVVGETQQGKSTLIQNLGTYADLPDLDIEIGNGNRSCTRSSEKYDLDIPLRSFHLEDFDGSTIQINKDNYTELCGYGEDDAKVVVNSQGESGSAPTLKFSFVDTPGLNDSEGEDMELMAGILGKVAELEYVHAVVYVRNSGKHFGPSFKTFFEYLQKSMPALARGLVVVHSSYTARRVDSHLREGKDWAEIRREGFKAATNLDLAHFFMDNEPDSFSPLAVMLSMNETCALLSHIKEQPAQPVTSFRLLKTPRMQEIDVHITNALADVKRNLKNQLEGAKAGLAIAEQRDMEDGMEIGSMKRKLANVKEDLQNYENGPDIVLGSISIQEEYSFIDNLIFSGELGLEGRAVAFDADCPIGYIKKSTSGGSKWLAESQQGSSWRAFITTGLFNDIKGSATFYVKSAERYRTEIRVLRESRGSLEDRLHQLEARKSSASAIQKNAQKLSGLFEQCNDLNVTASKDTIDMTLYPKLRPIYLTKEVALSRGEIFEFLTVYDKDLADFYERS
ncbi:hypothetical protein ABW20_dc0103520 [Dactylellina cionopaga]|nr:hypothetical protein ABW20_dc0103520 [Dactylellina cionopaga]